MRAVLAAVIHLEGGPVGRHEILALAGRAQLPRPGAASLELEPGAAFLRQLAVPSPAAPPVLGPRGLRVLLDGTLTRHAELAQQLGAPAEATAAELVATAYERWGERLGEHLDGELAYLVWDPRARRLLAGRDPFGVRELFYRRHGDRLWVASQLRMLTADLGPEDLDEEYAADFLSAQCAVGEATALRSVRRVRAGCTLRLEGSRLSSDRTWVPRLQPELAHLSLPASAEAFRAAFGEAVLRTSQGPARLWAELSGGLDSSSIVCTLEELRRSGAAVPPLSTLALVWNDTEVADERPWSRTVVEKYRLDHREVPADDAFFDGALEAARFRSDPHFGLLCGPMFDAELGALEAQGATVLLCGSRAESVVFSDGTPPMHLAESLRRGRWLRFARDLGAWQRASHEPLANLFFSYGLRPALSPATFYRSTEDRGAVDPWIASTFAARLDLGRRLQRPRAERLARSLTVQTQLERLARSEPLLARGKVEWAVEARHPFLDRALVELSLSLPWQAKVSPTEGKPLLREALRGVLPEKVRTRIGGAGPGPSAYKAFARRWDRLKPFFESSKLVELGFLDGPQFQRAAELARFGACEKFGAFTSALAFEIWLTSLFGPPLRSAA
jgi:asparagine synthase (glutamine-hydrolysing)